MMRNAGLDKRILHHLLYVRLQRWLFQRLVNKKELQRTPA